MISIAVSNRKGGTGKSTVSTHLAAGLAHRGYNVCLVDTDSQGDASSMLGMEPTDALFSVMVDNVGFEKAITAVRPGSYQVPDAPAAGEFWILPSSSRTSIIPSLVRDPFKFLSLITQIKETFDYVIIDTAPTISMFDGSVFIATDAFLFVTLPQALSFKGLNEGIEQMMEFNESRKTIHQSESRLLGILPNMVQANTVNDRVNLSELAEHYRRYVWHPLMMRTKYKEASNFGELMFAYEPSSFEANEMLRVTDNVIAEVERE